MKVILENKLIHGIPLIECYTIDSKLSEEMIYAKPLLYLNHGFNSKKEDNYELMIELANHGFFVVTLDAYLHGERISEPFLTGQDKERELLFFDIVRRTGKDLTYLFKHHYNKYFKDYSVMGISMGGFISFYAATLSQNVKGIVAIIASPSFVGFAKQLEKDFEPNIEEFNEKMLSLKEDDPMSHMEHFEHIKILMICGEKDEMVPDKWAKEFYDILVNKGINKEVKLISYDLGHEVTEKMVKDISAWCVSNLL